MSRKLLPALALAAVMAFAPAAHAATDSTSVTLTGGSLTYTTPFSAGDFDGVTIGSTSQTTYADVNNWSVTDNRGTLAGWNVTISASRFTNDKGTPADATDDVQFPAGSLSLVALGTATTDASNLSVGPVLTPAAAIDGGAGAGSAIANALLGTGGGQWTISPGANNDDLALVVPTGMQAGTYTSTITTTLGTSGL